MISLSELFFEYLVMISAYIAPYSHTEGSVTSRKWYQFKDHYHGPRHTMVRSKEKRLYQESETGPSGGQHKLAITIRKGLGALSPQKFSLIYYAMPYFP